MDMGHEEKFPDGDAWAATITDDFKSKATRQTEMPLTSAAPASGRAKTTYETFANLDLTKLGM
ncbi:MAG: hypothetical protein IT560_05475 [Alphaproteobacteria bacterium]|jgi:hypothetical protein|nr:hypothetical protein [Alphaproteobacteria bacterium]